MNNQLEDRYLTRIAKNEIYFIDPKEEFSPDDMEYILTLNTDEIFYEYALFYAKKAGYNGKDKDLNLLANFIYKKGEENNASLSSIVTVKNWLKKAPPTGNQQGRENVYRFCFALNMNAEETMEFFLKAYLERPFNYKNINESVYFFCMNNGLSYADAEKIISKINTMPIVENEDAEDVTEQIGEDISLITSEEDIIKYISDNRSGFSVQNKTATKEIKNLVKKCIELANDEKVKCRRNDEGNVESIDDLLKAITGYNAREKENGENLYKEKSISKSRLPLAIRKNFPQREQYKNIEVGKASFDVIRKFLIILNFYHFFTKAYINDREGLENDGKFDEFIFETDILLKECGYVQLYPRNPYDWMFMYCAWKNDIDTFKDIIEEFYLSELDN